MLQVGWWQQVLRRRAFLAMVGLTSATLAGRLATLPRIHLATDEELAIYWQRQSIEPQPGTPLDDKRLWRYRFTGFLPDLRLNSVEGEQQYDPLTYRLRIGGLVEQPLELTVNEIWRLPHEEQVSDFFCVDGWAVQGLAWRGIRLKTLFDRIGLRSSATHLGLRSIGGVYSESIPLEVALRDDVMLATDLRGERLPSRHGAPLRLLVPPMYGYKSIKWVDQIDLLPRLHIGYWERRGYPPDAWL